MDIATLRRRVAELLDAASATRNPNDQAILITHAAELLSFVQLEELSADPCAQDPLNVSWPMTPIPRTRL